MSISLAFSITSWSQAPAAPSWHYYQTEWNSVMVESTYEILDTTPHRASGTAFILAVPTKSETKVLDPKSSATAMDGKPVLITAAHVLRAMLGDFAIIDMRSKEGDAWTEVKIPLHIRQHGHPLWVEHPAADVAVMWINDRRVEEHLIEPLVPTSWLATDQWLEHYQIHPGDEVTCLGYPEAITSQFGFPILRMGRIASFPILPTLTSRPLYIDFPVYGGNSGGPAYIVPGGTRGNVVSTEHVPKIIGLVTMKQFGVPTAQNAVAATPSNQLSDQHLSDMHLAILEPSSVITEALSFLP